MFQRNIKLQILICLWNNLNSKKKTEPESAQRASVQSKIDSLAQPCAKIRVTLVSIITLMKS